jgi:hypothetical protein
MLLHLEHSTKTRAHLIIILFSKQLPNSQKKKPNKEKNSPPANTAASH